MKKCECGQLQIDGFTLGMVINALDFYADPKNYTASPYNRPGEDFLPVEYDAGKRAAKALEYVALIPRGKE
jgi:hypothetical protein